MQKSPAQFVSENECNVFLESLKSDGLSFDKIAEFRTHIKHLSEQNRANEWRIDPEDPDVIHVDTQESYCSLGLIKTKDIEEVLSSYGFLIEKFREYFSLRNSMPAEQVKIL